VGNLYIFYRAYIRNNTAQLSQGEIISVNWLLCFGFFDHCLDLMCSDNDGVREERLLVVVD